jgi:hypothetical protein
MTMTTDGKQIEDLKGEEQARELRLRYAGAIRALCHYELRAVAARLVAIHPLYTAEDFTKDANEAFREVCGEVHSNARDARHETLGVD